MFYYMVESLIFIISFLLIVSFFTLWERKLLGGIQKSHGPVFTGSFGLLQAIADGLKLLGKETVTPTNFFYFLFFLSAIFSVSLSFLSWALMPFNEIDMYTDLNFNVLLLFIFSSLNVYSIMFAGWASTSKYGLLGSLRAVAQLISYEIPLFLTMLPIFFCMKNFNLLNIINFQVKSVSFMVLMLPCAILFLILALAETNRTPFDLAEAESELVSGYNIEYSSIAFAFFFLAEYNHILVMSALFSMLFFGNWNYFTMEYFILEYIFRDFYKPEMLVFFYYFDHMFLVIFFFMKMLIMSSIFMMVSSVLPRYKYINFMKIGWQVFIPFLIFINLFICFILL